MYSAGYDAGNYAKIMINNHLVEMEKNMNGHYRGLHIVVIDPSTGDVETAKVFDTFESMNTLAKFIKEPIPEGHIVMVACKDDCATQLSDAGKTWFEKVLGSKLIQKVGYRQGFALIAVIGRPYGINEQAAFVKEEKVCVTQILQVYKVEPDDPLRKEKLLEVVDECHLKNIEFKDQKVELKLLPDHPEFLKSYTNTSMHEFVDGMNGNDSDDEEFLYENKYVQRFSNWNDKPLDIKWGEGRLHGFNLFLLTRTLRVVLREHASKLGLNIRSDGFCPIADVISIKQIDDFGATMGDIATIVERDKKERLEVRVIDGVMMIRAVHGHAMPDVIKEEHVYTEITTDTSQPFNVFNYNQIIHRTYVQRKILLSIKKQGLKPGDRTHIHMSSDHMFPHGIPTPDVVFT